MKKIASLISVLALVAVLSISCAKSDHAESNLAESPGQNSTEEPNERRAPLFNWLQIHEEFKPAIIGIGGCQKPYQFTVMRDGSFTAGPCKSNGSTDSGRLTEAELAKLVKLADNFATADLGIHPDCEFDIHLGDDVVYITLPPNSHLQIKSYEGLSFQTCYHGGRDKAGPLSSYLRGLLKKYYPRD